MLVMAASIGWWWHLSRKISIRDGAVRQITISAISTISVVVMRAVVSIAGTMPTSIRTPSIIISATRT